MEYVILLKSQASREDELGAMDEALTDMGRAHAYEKALIVKYFVYNIEGRVVRYREKVEELEPLYIEIKLTLET